MLSAILASMTVLRSTGDCGVEVSQPSDVDETETTPLIPSAVDPKDLDTRRSAKLSGIIGFSSGLGALFAGPFLH